MKNTTKAIFSLGLISFLALGGICQNAFAAESTPGCLKSGNMRPAEESELRGTALYSQAGRLESLSMGRLA